MEALIAAIWNIILEFWPWTIIDKWELAIRVRWGKTLTPLKPGIRLCLPFIDRVLTEPATLQTVNIQDQTMVTLDVGKDGRRVNASVSGVVKYHVLDLRQLWLTVHDHDEAIANTALESIAAHIAVQTFVELDPVELGRAAQRTLRRETRHWGIRVKSFKITDLADSSVHRIMSNSGDSTLVLGRSE